MFYVALMFTFAGLFTQEPGFFVAAMCFFIASASESGSPRTPPGPEGGAA